MKERIMIFNYFITIAILTSFLNLIVIKVWASGVGQNMPGLEDVREEKLSLRLKLTQNKEEERENKELLVIPEKIDSERVDLPLISVPPAYIESLPDEILVHIFSFLTLQDLGKAGQVSYRWYEVCNEPQLWRKAGLENYGDCFSTADLKENPKQKVIFYQHVNMQYPQLSTTAKRLVISENVEEVERVITNILEGKNHTYLYKYDYKDENIEDLNDFLVRRNSIDAIKRKIEWYTYGTIKIKNPNYYIPRYGDPYYPMYQYRREVSHLSGDAWGRHDDDYWRNYEKNSDAASALKEVLNILEKKNAFK